MYTFVKTVHHSSGVIYDRFLSIKIFDDLGAVHTQIESSTRGGGPVQQF